MFSWKTLHNRALLKTATISNYPENNLTRMHPQLKVGHESIHLQQGAQRIHKMSQNLLCPSPLPSIPFLSSFILLPFFPISSFIYPFLNPCCQIKPSLIPLPAWLLLILDLSQFTDLAAPAVWLYSFCIKSYNFLIWVIQSQQWEH